jgi:hypothetical protein
VQVLGAFIYYLAAGACSKAFPAPPKGREKHRKPIHTDATMKLLFLKLITRAEFIISPQYIFRLHFSNVYDYLSVEKTVHFAVNRPFVHNN